MPNRRSVVTGGLALALAGCATPVIRSYNGPEVTRVVIFKGEHRMFLLNGATILKSYGIDLGFQPRGAKRIRGDGKTPFQKPSSDAASRVSAAENEAVIQSVSVPCRAV